MDAQIEHLMHNEASEVRRSYNNSQGPNIWFSDWNPKNTVPGRGQIRPVNLCHCQQNTRIQRAVSTPSCLTSPHVVVKRFNALKKSNGVHEQ